MMRLLEIRADPLSHFLPTKTTPDGHSVLIAGPPGLAPELAELFMFPVYDRSPRRQREGGAGGPPNKRARTAGTDVSEVELGRRAHSQGLSNGSPFKGGMDESGDFFGGGWDGDMDVAPMGVDINMNFEDNVAPYKRVEGLVDDTRSTPGFLGDEDPNRTYDDLGCPIGIFDLRPQGDKQSGETQPEAQAESEVQEGVMKGFSKNTVRALGIVQRELAEDAFGGEDKALSFEKTSQKVNEISRQTA